VNHTPFGYIIEDGKAIIDDKAASQIRDLFHAYLSGLSLADAAENVGIKRCHPAISKMLINRRYIGDDFYPGIVDEEVFQQVEAERLRRAHMLGRIYEPKASKTVLPRIRFFASEAQSIFDDPFQQAEYAYGLIESEVIADGE
jgi:hypothetical protein